MAAFLHRKQSYKWLLLLVVCASAVCCMVHFCVAHAEENDVYAQASAAQQQLEESSAAYEQTQQTLAQIEAEIQENEQRIQELSAQIPAQQEKSNAAIRSLYKMQQEGESLVVLLFSSGNFNDLLANINYITVVYNTKIKEINSLASMKAELDATAASLSEKREQAEQETLVAKQQLAQAQELREQAQAAANAARKAEEEQAAAAAAAAEEAARLAEEEQANSGQQEGELSGGDVSPSPGSDDADWSVDKSTFVNEWASRIDAYLAGSPLAGQGSTFASAAWEYGVDPRFSPAISCVESSKGLYCFRNHNAWGWGSVDWDSWEEAIEAHVRGLARGYGYTVTVEGAKKYCPPNWEFWYARVCAEMAKI